SVFDGMKPPIWARRSAGRKFGSENRMPKMAAARTTPTFQRDRFIMGFAREKNWARDRERVRGRKVELRGLVVGGGGLALGADFGDHRLDDTDINAGGD